MNWSGTSFDPVHGLLIANTNHLATLITLLPRKTLTQPGKWDADSCYKPFALFDGKRWLLWYNGRKGDVEQIGVAMHDGEDLGFGREKRSGAGVKPSEPEPIYGQNVKGPDVERG